MMGQESQVHSLREELRAVFNRAKLPSNPTVAAEVLNLVRDPNSTVGQFAKFIEADPALAARLMKMSNSVYFSQRKPVTTIQRAVTVLGLRRINMVAASFQLASHLDRLGKTPFDLGRFWQQSVLRACLAREIAAHVVPEYAEESFLVGLLQDCGILLLVQMGDAAYNELCCQEELSPTAYYAAERKHCKYHHVDMIEALSDEWGLDELIAKPLRQHHTRVRLHNKSNGIERLCAVSYFVGSVNWSNTSDVSATELKLLEYASQELKLDEEILSVCFQAAGLSYAGTAELFGEMIPSDIDVMELLAEANHQLLLAASERDQKVEQIKVERDQYIEEHSDLCRAVAQYREKASKDPLTNLLNRGALLEATQSFLQMARENDEAVSVFFFDIDNFKMLNDEKGHDVGDQVLKAIANATREATGNAGGTGRYGGEEFVVVIPGQTREKAQRQAKHLVQTIRDLNFKAIGIHHPVTCSLGAIWGKTDAAPEQLFKQADELMYQAKRSGKDRCIFQALPEQPSKAEGESRPGYESEPESHENTADTSQPGNPRKLKAFAARMSTTDSLSVLANDRKQPRKSIHVVCKLCYLTGLSMQVHFDSAIVLDISAGGIGLLYTQPLIRGNIVEISIQKPEGCFFAAGLVAYSRQLRESIHQIGVQMINHSSQPIFSQNPQRAIRELNWLQEAVKDMSEDQHETRRSA